MLSQAVQPPTTEHVYAQWQEREELLSMAPPEILQEDNGQSLDVKEEEAVALMSGEPMSQNHFKTSRAVRLKGNAVRTEDNKVGNLYFKKKNLCSVSVFTFVHISVYREKGPAFKS